VDEGLAGLVPADRVTEAQARVEHSLLVCSFCQRGQAAVRTLIAGERGHICGGCAALARYPYDRAAVTIVTAEPGTGICHECLDLCQQIIDEEDG